MPTLVPTEDFPNAVSLGIIVFNVATIGGPAIAGFMLAESGPALIYGINALSFLAVIGALIAMRTSGKPGAARWIGERRLSFGALKRRIKVRLAYADHRADYDVSTLPRRSLRLQLFCSRSSPRRRLACWRSWLWFSCRGAGNRISVDCPRNGAHRNFRNQGRLVVVLSQCLALRRRCLVFRQSTGFRCLMLAGHWRG